MNSPPVVPWDAGVFTPFPDYGADGVAVRNEAGQAEWQYHEDNRHRKRRAIMNASDLIRKTVDNPEQVFMSMARQSGLDGFWNAVGTSGDYGSLLVSACAASTAALKADGSFRTPIASHDKGIPWPRLVSDALASADLPMGQGTTGPAIGDKTLDILSSSLAGIMFSYDAATLINASPWPDPGNLCRTVKATFGSSREHAFGYDHPGKAPAVDRRTAMMMVKGLAKAMSASGFMRACERLARQDMHDPDDFMTFAPMSSAMSRIALAMGFDGMPADDATATVLAVAAFGHWSPSMEEAFVDAPWQGTADGVMEAAGLVLDDGDNIPGFVAQVFSLMRSWEGPPPSAGSLHGLLSGGAPHSSDARTETIIQLVDFLTSRAYLSASADGMCVASDLIGPLGEDVCNAYARALHGMLADGYPLSFIIQDLIASVRPSLGRLHREFCETGRPYPGKSVPDMPVELAFELKKNLTTIADVTRPAAP